jgi:hypothetical protein
MIRTGTGKFRAIVPIGTPVSGRPTSLAIQFVISRCKMVLPFRSANRQPLIGVLVLPHKTARYEPERRRARRHLRRSSILGRPALPGKPSTSIAFLTVIGSRPASIIRASAQARSRSHDTTALSQRATSVHS